MNVPKPPDSALIFPLISADVANSCPAKLTLNGFVVAFGSSPPAQKTDSPTVFAAYIPASLSTSVELTTAIYPSVELISILPLPLTVFEIPLLSISHPAIVPALARIDPVAASIVTELVPFATFKPFEFNANPFPDSSPPELIVPLYIAALVVDINILPLNVPLLAVISPSTANVVPFHEI